jgi:hypothetical protein
MEHPRRLDANSKCVMYLDFHVGKSNKRLFARFANLLSCKTTKG